METWRILIGFCLTLLVLALIFLPVFVASPEVRSARRRPIPSITEQEKYWKKHGYDPSEKPNGLLIEGFRWLLLPKENEVKTLGWNQARVVNQNGELNYPASKVQTLDYLRLIPPEAFEYFVCFGNPKHTIFYRFGIPQMTLMAWGRLEKESGTLPALWYALEIIPPLFVQTKT